MASEYTSKHLIHKLELFSDWERRLLCLNRTTSNPLFISKCLNLLHDIKYTHIHYYLQLDKFNNEVDSLLLTSPELVWDINT